MTHNLPATKRLFAVLCVLLASLCALTPAFAQLDYDTYDIYQSGVPVGVIYVPQRGPDQSVYLEYWVMTNRYVYPSEKTPVTTEIKQSAGYRYTSLSDFFAKAPWGDGYRFVTVIADDRGVLPGRTATSALTSTEK